LKRDKIKPKALVRASSTAVLINYTITNIKLTEAKTRERKAVNEVEELTDVLSQKVIDLEEARWTLHVLSEQVMNALGKN